MGFRFVYLCFFIQRHSLPHKKGFVVKTKSEISTLSHKSFPQNTHKCCCWNFCFSYIDFLWGRLSIIDFFEVDRQKNGFSTLSHKLFPFFVEVDRRLTQNNFLKIKKTCDTSRSKHAKPRKKKTTFSFLEVVITAF